jgi:hypothetical protein
MGCWPLAALVLNDLAEVAAVEQSLEPAVEAEKSLREIAGRLERELYEALADLGTAHARLAAGRHAEAVGHAEKAWHFWRVPAMGRSGWRRT